MSSVADSNPKPNPEAEAVWYSCSCHCGATSFKISHERLESTSKAAPVLSCNCSICSKNGYLLIYVFRADMKDISGWESLQGYRFASKRREHKFCKVCGTSIGIDFMGGHRKGDILAVNARIIQGIDFTKLNVYPGDGKNYQPEYNEKNT